MVDNVLIAPSTSCDARAALYANGHDLKDPLLSPVYGDMRGFPPTILNSGTRDLLLSNTVRVHRKLRQAGVVAELHVHEGQAHGSWYRDASAPEIQGGIRGDRPLLRQPSGKIIEVNVALRATATQACLGRDRGRIFSASRQAGAGSCDRSRHPAAAVKQPLLGPLPRLWPQRGHP